MRFVAPGGSDGLTVETLSVTDPCLALRIPALVSSSQYSPKNAEVERDGYQYE
jgi:hypothetical protein